MWMWTSVTSYASLKTGLDGLDSAYNALIGGNKAVKIAEEGKLKPIKHNHPSTLSGDHRILGYTHPKLSESKGGDHSFLTALSNIFGYLDENNEEKRLTASQNILRASFLQIETENGAQGGLNVAVGCEGAFPGEFSEKSIVRRASSTFHTPSASVASSGADFSRTGVHRSEHVFGVESSSFELYPEETVQSAIGTRTDIIPKATKSSSPIEVVESDSSQSIVSVYLNPKYGAPQREHAIPTTINLEVEPKIPRPSTKFSKEIQNCCISTSTPVCSPDQHGSDWNSTESSRTEIRSSEHSGSTASILTEILLQPLVSDTSVGMDEPEMFDPAPVNTEADESSNPAIAVRDYNFQIKIGESEIKLSLDEEKASKTEVPHNAVSIPLNSWINCPVPGDIIPHGLVLFLPFAIIAAATFLAYLAALLS